MLLMTSVTGVFVGLQRFVHERYKNSSPDGSMTVVKIVNNNSNNNNQDNVYGAVVMSRATARFHPIHAMNAEQRQLVAEIGPSPPA